LDFFEQDEDEARCLSLLTVGLATAGATGGRPGEVSNRDDEEAVAVVGQTGEGVVPGGEGGEETEEATGHEDRLVGLVLGVTLDVTDTEQEEAQVEEEEQQEESDSGAEGAEEQDGGEDEPALRLLARSNRGKLLGERTHHQVQTERVVPHGRATSFLQRTHDLETTRSQDNGEREPETTVRRERGRTKGVTDSHFPTQLASEYTQQLRRAKLTTCQQATGQDHHNRKRDQRQCWAQKCHEHPC